MLLNKMDGRNTRKNWNEFGRAEGCDTGKKTMEEVLFDHRSELTAQGNKVEIMSQYGMDGKLISL